MINPSSSSSIHIPHKNRNVQLCPKCKGEGQIRARRSKKESFLYKQQIEQAERDNQIKPPPPPPRYNPCKHCQNTGLISSLSENNTHTSSSSSAAAAAAFQIQSNHSVAIVGGGIGGLALALSLQHRNIPFQVYERDTHFTQRKQGYGLTMQQGTKALKSLGIYDSTIGIHSKRHLVFDSHGNQLGQWGRNIWGKGKKESKRQNAHIPRQELRKLLLEQIDPNKIQWGCKLMEYQETEKSVIMTFQGLKHSNDIVTKQSASILVGADGIRSKVRSIKLGSESTTRTPLKYLGCIVILGICDITNANHDYVDGETVFQTADGMTRIYTMPYSSTQSMWQLSFPLPEQDAIHTSHQGPHALYQLAMDRCGSWHDPIPYLLQQTPLDFISGYPVYDRTVLEPQDLRKSPPASDPDFHDTPKLKYDSRVTLLGDAAHPMSPFKGQGANQALLDAVQLSRSLFRAFSSNKSPSNHNLITHELAMYEKVMLEQGGKKVRASAKAAKILHSDIVLTKGNVTRGAAAEALEGST